MPNDVLLNRVGVAVCIFFWLLLMTMAITAQDDGLDAWQLMG